MFYRRAPRPVPRVFSRCAPGRNQMRNRIKSGIRIALNMIKSEYRSGIKTMENQR